MSVPQGISEAMASELPRSGSYISMDGSQTSSAGSASSQDPAAQLSLTQAIKNAAKPHHTQLNRLIIDRLPLALPPHNNDPTVYAVGMRHLLPVYHAFETAWARYVSVEPKTPTMEDFSMGEAVLSSVLVHLNISQLARTDRLRQDIATLLGVGLGELDSWMMRASKEEDVVNAELEEDDLQAQSRSQRFNVSSSMVEEEDGDDVVEEDDPEALDRSSVPLEEDVIEHPALYSFIRHIQEITEEKPHVLLAYGWVLYMALFNGGRWIRAQLSTARESWNLSLVTATQGPTALADKDETGISFWHLDGAHDGEDIKDEFKARMRDVEPMLTDEQREDIVQESVIIFRAISRLVEELDAMTGIANVEKREEEETDVVSQVDVAEDEFEDDPPMMVRSHLLRPRWENPLGYLQLIFQILLPVGLWELLMLMVRNLQGATVHWPALRWTSDDGVVFGPMD